MKLTKPLTNNLKKGAEFDVNNDAYKKCFEICKNMLIADPILSYPDFQKPFILTSDASNFALGAVLSQIHENKEHPICYASRTLNEHEVNYSAIEKELLAIIYGQLNISDLIYSVENSRFKQTIDH